MQMGAVCVSTEKMSHFLQGTDAYVETNKKNTTEAECAAGSQAKEVQGHCTAAGFALHVFM